MDLGKINFSQSYEDGNTITHTIRGDSSLDEVLEAFEHFLKGAGYHLPEGCHIGYEYDEDDDNDRSKDEFHIEVGDFGAAQPIYTDYPFADSGVEDTVEHSVYYWDKDRNK